MQSSNFLTSCFPLFPYLYSPYIGNPYAGMMPPYGSGMSSIYNIPGYTTVDHIPIMENGYPYRLKFGGAPRNMQLRRGFRNSIRSIFPRTVIGLDDSYERAWLRSKNRLKKLTRKPRYVNRDPGYIEIKFTPKGPSLIPKHKRRHRMRNNMFKMFRSLINKFASQYFRSLHKRDTSNRIFYPAFSQEDIRQGIKLIKNLIGGPKAIYLSPRIINQIYLPKMPKNIPRLVQKGYPRPYIPRPIQYIPRPTQYISRPTQYISRPSTTIRRVKPSISQPLTKRVGVGYSKDIEYKLTRILNNFLQNFTKIAKSAGIKGLRKKEKRKTRKRSKEEKVLKKLKKFKKSKKSIKSKLSKKLKKLKKVKLSKKYLKKIKILKLLIKKGIIIPLQGSKSSVKRYLKVVDKRLYYTIKPSSKKSKSKRYIVYSKYSMPLNKLTYKLLKVIKPRYRMLVIPKINVVSKKKYRYHSFKKAEWKSFSQLLRQISGLMNFDPNLALRYSKPLIPFLNRYYHHMNNYNPIHHGYTGPLYGGFHRPFPYFPQSPINTHEDSYPQLYDHITTDRLLSHYMNNLNRPTYVQSLSQISSPRYFPPQHFMNHRLNTLRPMSRAYHPLHNKNHYSSGYSDPLSGFPNDLSRINSVSTPSIQSMLSRMGNEDVDAHLKILQRKLRFM